MIYNFIKQIIKVALFFFFKKIVVSGKENIPEKGPLIIVANHPNTLMDPLIIAAITKQRIGFLGKAGIFSNLYIARFLTYFHVIPVFRKKDIAAGEKPDNKKTFLKCHEYLNREGTILIFPEGSSYYELKLRDIKTGTARIALSFESLKNFEGNLKILPIALDYSDAIQFRSMVSVTVNEPISLDTYKQTYLKNEIEGVQELTAAIRKVLEKDIPHTDDKEQEEFLIKAHKFYNTFYESKTNLHEYTKRSLALRKQLSKVLKYLNENYPKLYQDTQNKAYYFFYRLKGEGITAGFFTNEFLKKNRVWVTFSYFLKFLFLLPIYVFGLLLNYIPYILPSKIFESLKTDIEYKTPVQMTTGLITFPLFYFLDVWLFRTYISTDFWYTVIFLVSIPVSGYIAMYYWTELKRFIRVLHFYFFMKKDRKLKLLKLRDEIFINIENARKRN